MAATGKVSPVPPQHHPHHHPHNPPHRIGDAVEMGQIIVLTCGKCHRQVNYLASDLEKVLGRDKPVYQIDSGCAGCQSRDWVRIKVRLPDQRDFGTLVIRRPGRVRQVRQWFDETLK